MINYELKSKLIGSSILEEYKKVSKSFYNHNMQIWYDDYVPLDNTYDSTIAMEIDMYYRDTFPVEWKECKRICSAHRHRILRLKRRVEFMLSSKCIFLTLTFNDLTLSKVSSISRKEYVKSFLRSLDCLYIANQDFGKTNGREHYHAIVQCSNVDYSKWTYGAINGLRVRNTTDDVKRVAKYVAKLTNHAIKVTNKRSVIMYCRKFPKGL